jgi:hypothetical protein
MGCLWGAGVKLEVQQMKFLRLQTDFSKLNYIRNDDTRSQLDTSITENTERQRQQLMRAMDSIHLPLIAYCFKCNRKRDNGRAELRWSD